MEQSENNSRDGHPKTPEDEATKLSGGKRLVLCKYRVPVFSLIIPRYVKYLVQSATHTASPPRLLRHCNASDASGEPASCFFHGLDADLIFSINNP